MRHVDFSPLYRSTVGFDRLFSLLDTLARPTAARPIRPTISSGPARTPTASRWRSPASADDEIAIEAHRNVLTVKGERAEEKKEDGNEVLYRGIAARAFERRFQLADHVEVTARR